jgi:hypothetical protein
VATSEAGEKAWPPSPRVVIEASANIARKAESLRAFAVRRPVSPLAAGGCPSFYRPRRKQLTCVPHYFYTCCDMASSAIELMVVLTNLAQSQRRGASCARTGAAEGRGVVVDRSGFERARGGR